MKIDYEDIPPDLIKPLLKKVVRKNKKIAMWNSLSLGVVILLVNLVMEGAFPQRQDLIAKIIWGGILGGSLGALLWKAAVDPQIIRAVEREYGKTVKEE